MTNSPAATTSSEATGEVFDLGYRPFEGSREGRFQALRAIWRDSIRASLGLGRSLGSKLLPIVIIGLAFAPAVVMMVIIGFVASFGGDTEEFGLPSNAEYYGFASVPLMLAHRSRLPGRPVGWLLHGQRCDPLAAATPPLRHACLHGGESVRVVAGPSRSARSDRSLRDLARGAPDNRVARCLLVHRSPPLCGGDHPRASDRLNRRVRDCCGDRWRRRC